MYNSAQYFGTWSYTDSYYYYCSTTTYSSLTSCSRRYRPSSSSCNYNDHVGLWCPSTSKNFNNNKGLYKISTFLYLNVDALKAYGIGLCVCIWCVCMSVSPQVGSRRSQKSNKLTLFSSYGVISFCLPRTLLWHFHSGSTSINIDIDNMPLLLMCLLHY